jgi:hypothetical protein
MSKYYTIKITGGTSPGPYTVYYDQILNNLYIPPIYNSDPPRIATDLSYSELSNGSGIIVMVPDETTILFLYNQYCSSGITLIPTKVVMYQNFCLTITYNNTTTFNHFITTSSVNGYPSWVEVSEPSITITYDGTKWILNGYSVGSGSIISNDPPTSNPPSNWVMIGTVGNNTINYNVGSCTNVSRSSFPVSINQPTCFCDGSIIFNVNLDNPPFSYSIDNGVTYTSSPIFSNLCSGIYVLSVVDTSGDTFSKTVTLDNPLLATTYTMTLNTLLTTPLSNEISLINSYETTFNITPPLPDGTTITFDLIHSNSFYSSPTSGTSILTTGTVLSKNLTNITYDSSVTGNTQSTNTTPGCQSNFIYQTNINEVWNSITLTNTDTITISTTSRVDKTTTGLCVVGYSNDTYSIANAVISGCDCCSLIVNT